MLTPARASRTLALLHVVVPIAIGGLIYLAWRSPTLLMFRWLDLAGLSVQPLRNAVGSFAPDSPMIAFSLPTALWAYAVVSFFCLVWYPLQGVFARAWIGIGCAVAIGSEVAQAVQFIPGTFERVDLLTVSAAVCVALWRHGRFVMRDSNVPVAA
jgi:hypothetical protein